MSAPAFWDDLYARHADGWELGQPAPPLVDFVDATPLPRGRVAVPGCGRGHDARFLADRGYDVVGFDFATSAIAEARRLAKAAGARVDFQQRDIFSLGSDYAHAFDGVWEYTCFCAIDPRRRAEYVRVMAGILRPAGWFLACFYPVRAGGSGPPFPVRMVEVRRLFVPPFRIERVYAPTRSARQRQGQERMVLARHTLPSA